MHWVTRIAEVVLLFALSAASARAQDAHYQTFLVGERAQGLGGAFTGLADDPSAAYYNPAGLAHLPSSALSGSLSVNAFDSHVVADAYSPASAIPPADFEHDDDPSVPIFVGLVKKFGRRDEQRVRRHAVALSTLHPSRRSLSYAVSVFGEDAIGRVDHSLRIRQDDRMTWYGPSYAFRLSPAFALGVSAFLSTRSLEHREDLTNVTTGMRDAMGVYTNPTVAVRESVTTVDVQHLVFRIGAQWIASPQWRIGIMVQPPGIEIAGESTVSERRVQADSLTMPPSATFYDHEDDGMPASYPIPPEVRVGMAWTPMEQLTLALDVSVYSGWGSESNPVRMIGQSSPDPETDEPAQPGDFVPQTWYRVPTFNVSLGADMVLFDVIPLRAGVFTNRSAAPAVPAETNILGVDDVDMYGASLSVGIRSGDYDLALGVTGLIGSGDGYAQNSTGTMTFTRTTVEDQVLYFFLSGAKRAVSRLARTAYDEVLDEEVVPE